jgi:hypothetical protein
VGEGCTTRNLPKEIAQAQRRAIELINQYEAKSSDFLEKKIDDLTDDISDMQADSLLRDKSTNDWERDFDNEVNDEYGAAMFRFAGLKKREDSSPDGS